MKDLIIVLPTLNEIESIEIMIQKLRALEIPFFVMDGRSSDGTIEKVKELNGEIYNRDGYSNGYGGGINKSIDIASEKGYKYLGLIDCDLTYPVEKFPDLYKAALNNDIVVGIRPMESIAFIRRLGNQIHTLLARILFRKKISDINSGMRVFRVEKFKGRISSKNFGFMAQMVCFALRNKYNYKEIPIYYSVRLGESKLRFIVDGLTIIYYIFLERFKSRI